MALPRGGLLDRLSIEPAAGGAPRPGSISLKSRALAEYKKRMGPKPKKQYCKDVSENELEAAALRCALEYCTPVYVRDLAEVRRRVMSALETGRENLKREAPTSSHSDYEPKLPPSMLSKMTSFTVDPGIPSPSSAARSDAVEYMDVIPVPKPAGGPAYVAPTYVANEKDDPTFDFEQLDALVENALGDFDNNEEDEKQPHHDAAAAQTSGSRAHMEDRYFICQSLDTLLGLDDGKTTFYMGIFDGHNGPYASIYTATQLHCNIGRQPSFPHDMRLAIMDGFVVTDERFYHKARREDLLDGTTATVVIVRDGVLYVANVGDSQAVLSRGGVASLVSTPQGPKRADEEERIKKAGGAVVWFGTWRVNGTLAVSRSIGDLEHRGVVIAEPEVTETRLCDADEFVIVASDGVWDVLKYQEAVDVVRDALKEPLASAGSAASRLMDEATARQSKDNISVCVVKFDHTLLPRDA